MIVRHRSYLMDKAVVFLLTCLAIIPFHQIFHLNVGFAIFNAGELLLLALFSIFIVIIIRRGLAKQHVVYVFSVLSAFVAYSLYSIAFLNVGTSSLIQQVRFFLPFIVACIALLSPLYIDKSKFLNNITYAISISALLAIICHLFFKGFISYSLASSDSASEVIIEGGRMYWGSGTLMLFGFAAVMLEKRKIKKYVLNFAVLMIFAGSIFTQNRTILATLIIFYIFTQRFVFKKSIQALTNISILAVISSVIFIFLSSDNMFALLQKRLFITDAASNELEHAFLVGRVYLYDQYLNIFQATFPFGQGLGRPFAHILFSGDPVFTSDISLVSFILPFGFVGLFMFLTFIFKIYKLFKNAIACRDDKSSAVFCFLLISFFLMSFNVDIFSRNIAVVYLTVFAVLNDVSISKKLKVNFKLCSKLKQPL